MSQEKDAQVIMTDGSTEQKAFGWLRDQPDPNDWPYGPPSAALRAPVDRDLREDKSTPPVYDQLTIGSCTANAVLACLEFAEEEQGQKQIRLSRLEAYFLGRQAINTVNEDSGAHIRDVVKATQHEGIAAERLWPYDVSKFKEVPPSSLRRSQRYHKTIEYRAVPRTIAAMRACISEGYPFTFGFPVYESFMGLAGEGVWTPSPTETIVGYHAVTCWGYKPRDLDDTHPWIVRNSWGEGWGQRGYFRVTSGFMSAQIFDLWTIRTTT